MKTTIYIAIAVISVATFRFPLDGANAQECKTLNGVVSYVTGIMSEKHCDVILDEMPTGNEAATISSRKHHSLRRGIPGKSGAKGEKGEPCTDVASSNDNTQTETLNKVITLMKQRLNECEIRLTTVESSLQYQQTEYEERFRANEELLEKYQAKIEKLDQKSNLEDFEPANIETVETINPPGLDRPKYCSDIAKAGTTINGYYRLYRDIYHISGTKVYCEFTQEGQTRRVVFSDCREANELYPSGSRISAVMPEPSINFYVYCQIDTYAWTVIQRRYDGSLKFNRNFDQYQNGFGSLNEEFWLGLQNIHVLTRSRSWVLRVEMETYENETFYAEYKDFSVGAGPGYTLTTGQYSGTAGHSLGYNTGRNFTTIDRDQDLDENRNCGEYMEGGWWYSNCGYINLNSFNYGNNNQRHKGLIWFHLKNNWITQLKTTLMKIRPRF